VTRNLYGRLGQVLIVISRTRLAEILEFPESACADLPAQQNAIVEAVSKSQLQVPEEMLRAMGLDLDLFRPPGLAFTPLTELERAVIRTVEAWDVEALVERCITERIERARGRV
jgi:hypothetical protein